MERDGGAIAMMVILPIHILAGMLALVFGYIALFAKKGAWLHRRMGTYFVYAMVVLSLTGAFRATATSSVVAGLLTFYFVMTGLITVRRATTPRAIHVAGVLLAISIGLFAFDVGREMVTHGRPEGAPMFLFGGMAMLAVIGDLRMMHAGGLTGQRRIARHLWRMCFAMWVAAASFFWGPPGRVPAIINIPALLPIPVLTPVAVMIYWLWRTRVRKSFREQTYDGPSHAEPHAT